VYIALRTGGKNRHVAAYEPTGDLRRTAKLLLPGNRIRAFGGVRRPTSLHPAVLNLEKFEFVTPVGTKHVVPRGTYISSPRANRHLTKPLIRYGRENYENEKVVEGWLEGAPTRPLVRA